MHRDSRISICVHPEPELKSAIVTERREREREKRKGKYENKIRGGSGFAMFGDFYSFASKCNKNTFCLRSLETF